MDVCQVFVSYKQEERERMRPMAEGLRALGVDVWFDEQLRPGRSFTEEITNLIHSCKAQLVCWSPGAVRSEWVRGEAEIGRQRGVLIASIIESCTLPPPFNMLHAENLVSWTGDAHHQGWRKIVDAVGSKVDRPGLGELAELRGSSDPAEWRRWARRYPSDPWAGAARFEAERLEAATGPLRGAAKDSGVLSAFRQESPPTPRRWRGNRLLPIAAGGALAVAFGLLALSAAPQRQQGQVPMIADSPAIVIPPTTPDQVTSAPRAEVAPNPATPALAALDRVSRHDWLAPNFGSLLPNVLADSSNVSLDAAARTDARAQFLVGGGHLYGIGGYRDDNAEAARFFRLSANQGFAPAQYYLGFISDTAGEHEDSARWYRLAANQGFLDAQFRLGAMYADGIGVPQDEAEAVRLFRRAADRGSADAQYNMGVMYDNGRGVMRDRVEAVRYWRLAARQGYPGAQTILRRLGETW